jgi:CheY-like chemotaxis protein
MVAIGPVPCHHLQGQTGAWPAFGWSIWCVMPQAAPARKIPPKRILVVDDEPQVADTIRMVLKMGGHQVEVAQAADRALDLFKASRHDLVISDLSLGKMDGLELARLIRELVPKQPIVLITAYAESVRLQNERLGNVDYILGKPFSIDQLQEILAKIFPPA